MMASASADHKADRSWIFPTLLMCGFGFFTRVKPSEPFLTPYLMGPIHNLTAEEVVNQVYPMWTYAYLVFLVPTLLLTDHLKYKPVIIIRSIGLIGCWMLLLFGRGVQQMQLMQICYALSSAAKVGCYAYIYRAVNEFHFQRVTSYVRSSALAGSFIASLLSQLLVSFGHLDYFYLNIISLVNVSIAFIISWLLPMPKSTPHVSPKQTFGVSRDNSTVNKEKVVNKAHRPLHFVPNCMICLWRDTRDCYSNHTLLRWSLWWAFSTCGWILVTNYAQNLWETIRPSTEYAIYNGAVESVATIFGAVGAFGVSYLKRSWKKSGELCLSFFSFAKCGLLMTMYWTTNIWVSYAAYVIFICAYNVIITIAQFQIALGLTTQRYALVFGVNTLAAVILNTVLTVIIVDKAGLGLDVHTQFILYSLYFGIVAFTFLLHAIYSLWCLRAAEVTEITVVE